ncbi:MAG TPA: hypothetical protein VIU15_34645 [Streptomyces sp.]
MNQSTSAKPAETDSPTGASQWLTLPHCKRVLVVVHTEVYGQRLLDILPLLESDLRVQVEFTIAPHVFNPGAARSLPTRHGGLIPWERAVRSRFDLVIAAGSQGLHLLNGPLLRLPHGAGHIKLSRPDDDRDPGSPRTVGGLGRQYLMRDGRVIPAALALAHHDDLGLLRRHCPEALPVAEVVGDSSYDLLKAGLRRRPEIRAALGLRRGQKLVVVSSTWGSGSSFNRLDALLPRLLAELDPALFRIAVIVHPNVWSGHGDWQVRSWLAPARAHGIAVVPPQADWRAPVIAADWLIGDHGSVTLYATLARVPVLLARFPSDDVNPDSPTAELARVAPALSAGHRLPEQFAYARSAYRADDYARIARQLSSEPGRFGRNLRRLMYRLLELGEPAHPPALLPLPLPAPLWGTAQGEVSA